MSTDHTDALLGKTRFRRFVLRMPFWVWHSIPGNLRVRLYCWCVQS